MVRTQRPSSEEQNNRFTSAVFLNIISVIVTALATVAVAIYTYKLSVSTDYIQSFSSKQTDEMIEQTKNVKVSLEQTRAALDYSKRQTEAAEAANLQNSQNSKKQLRAYIVYENIIIKTTSVAGDAVRYEVTLVVKNVGQTPALNLTTHSRAVITNKSAMETILSSGLDTATEDPDPTGYISVIGAGLPEKYTVPSVAIVPGTTFKDTNGFSKNEISSFESGKNIFWVSGILLYTDVFDEPHRTRFCLYFDQHQFDTRTYCHLNNDVE